jgi:hypothetical protein
LLALTLAGAQAGCGGSAIKRDARRLEKKCDVVRGARVSERQARCIAELFGVEDKKGCPMEVDRPDGFGEPVFRVRESCNGLGAVIAEADGRVLAFVSGDDILY